MAGLGHYERDGFKGLTGQRILNGSPPSTHGAGPFQWSVRWRSRHSVTFPDFCFTGVPVSALSSLCLCPSGSAVAGLECFSAGGPSQARPACWEAGCASKPARRFYEFRNRPQYWRAARCGCAEASSSGNAGSSTAFGRKRADAILASSRVYEETLAVLCFRCRLRGRSVRRRPPDRRAFCWVFYRTAPSETALEAAVTAGY